MDPARLLLGVWAWTCALAGVLAARTGPATRGVTGVTAWPGLLGGVIANVHVSHPGRSGHHVPAKPPVDQDKPADLTTAAQTYAQYEHFDARAPHQPVSVYQEFRLQQHHPPSSQYTTPSDAVADTTTFAPTYYSEQTAPPPQAQHQAQAAPGLHAYNPHAPPEATTAGSSPRPAAKSLGHHESTLHHELQMQLSQQIQVQLEQLQRLHELQNKMLKVPKELAPHQQAVQQSSEHVNRHVPHPELSHHGQHHQQPALQQGSEHVTRHVPHPDHSHHGHHQQQQQQQPVTAANPVVYAPTATPSPPPFTEPRYPEESQPLQAFIGETTSPPIGGAISNGFQPILPPAGRQPDAQHPGADADTDFQPSFQPFTEDATDPALPFYLLPPAEESGSQFHSLRDAPVDAPPNELGDVRDEESSASSELIDVAQAYRQSGRGKHRLRPPRVSQAAQAALALRKPCAASAAAGVAPPCRLLVEATAPAASAPGPVRPRGPGARRPATGPAGAGSTLRLRIASPRIRFREPIGSVDPRRPLTLMARHPGGPGRPPVTVVHAVQKIRVIRKRA